MSLSEPKAKILRRPWGLPGLPLNQLLIVVDHHLKIGGRPVY